MLELNFNLFYPIQTVTIFRRDFNCNCSAARGLQVKLDIINMLMIPDLTLPDTSPGTLCRYQIMEGRELILAIFHQGSTNSIPLLPTTGTFHQERSETIKKRGMSPILNPYRRSRRIPLSALVKVVWRCKVTRAGILPLSRSLTKMIHQECICLMPGSEP